VALGPPIDRVVVELYRDWDLLRCSYMSLVGMSKFGYIYQVTDVDFKITKDIFIMDVLKRGIVI